MTKLGKKVLLRKIKAGNNYFFVEVFRRKNRAAAFLWAKHCFSRKKGRMKTALCTLSASAKGKSKI